MTTPSHPDFICYCLKNSVFVDLKAFGRAWSAHAKITCFFCSLLLTNEPGKDHLQTLRKHTNLLIERKYQAGMVQILFQALQAIKPIFLAQWHFPESCKAYRRTVFLKDAICKYKPCALGSPETTLLGPWIRIMSLYVFKV